MRRVPDFRPEESDPLRRRGPLPLDPKDLQRGPSLDVLAIMQSLMKRVERLEEEMRTVKTKLKLP